MIKPAEGQTYVDVVRTIRQKVDPGQCQTEVKTIRKTKDGAVLLQLAKRTDGTEFHKVLQTAIGQTGQVKDLTSRVTLEFLDLDCVTTAKDVADAINRETGKEVERRPHVFDTNSRGQRLAVCEFEATEATDLLKKGRIKIGWVIARVRPRVRVPRCYKCLGFGHIKTNCTGPDRRDCCWRCGNGGHSHKACKSTEACFLCTDLPSQERRHLPGSSSCVAFKTALTGLKSKATK